MQNVLAVKDAPMSRDGRAGNFPESQETLRNSNDFATELGRVPTVMGGREAFAGVLWISQKSWFA